jgi:tRNA dimethylallyltransferase
LVLGEFAQQIMKSDMVLILGVTASGKGRLAFDLARKTGAEIVSVDSMKVYRRMDIGTAKPPKQARRRIKYHLIDVIEPSESFSVKAFVDAAGQAIEQIEGRDRPIIGVGGTALYVKALLYGLFKGPGTSEQIRAELRAQAQENGLGALHERLEQIDPDAAARIHPNDAKRIIRALEVYEITGKPISNFQQQWNTGIDSTPRSRLREVQDWTIIGLRRPKTEENRRINARVKQMIAAGLVDEVASLLRGEKPLSPQARCAIGYAELIDYLSGKRTLKDATELIKKHTRRLAKNQRTWFKTFTNIHWLDIDRDEPAAKTLSRTERLIEDCSNIRDDFSAA